MLRGIVSLRSLRVIISLILCCGLIGVFSLASTPASAHTPSPPGHRDDGDPSSGQSIAPAEIPPEQREAVLPEDWRASSDVAWATSGDMPGFHILTARENDGYAWRNLATLSEPGLETDMWVGNACLTSSGKKLVVVYEPRAFTNRTVMFDRGAFAAIVDLGTGAVTKLNTRVSIAYFNPGCGNADTAVLAQGETPTSSGRTCTSSLSARPMAGSPPWTKSRSCSTGTRPTARSLLHAASGGERGRMR